MAFDRDIIPKDLIEAIKGGKGGVYVGAGLSQSVGLPSWKGLLEELIELVENVSYKPNEEFISGVKELIEIPEKYLIAAQELKDLLQDDYK